VGEDDRNAIAPGDTVLLIIEDDPVFASIFGEVIRGQGFKYLFAPDGRAGLQLAKERKPSGIILDVNLPDIDGWQVMKELQTDPVVAAIPVHFLTAADAGERGMAMGAVGYLNKPATKRDLIRVVDALVPNRTSRATQVLVVESDDNPEGSLIEQLAGENIELCRVTTAREALKALEQQPFGCMILDLSLPDMDGLDLLRAVEEQCATEMPSVVVYTGRALSKEEAKRLEAYTEAVVIKEGPSRDRLMNEVRLFVRRLKEGLGPRQRPVVLRQSPDVHLRGHKVLIVEDDMRTLYALSATLRAKGINVLVADNGRAALDVLAEHLDVEVVLMDIMLPEMDGYETIRRIRQNKPPASLPIIALTAKAMKGDREKCLEAGATDYLPKPVDADRLMTMLHACLSEKAPDAERR
jgi:CheY-like chemotaxis protein